MKKTMQDLVKMFEEAKKSHCKIGVSIKGLPGLSGIETIVTEHKDLDFKLLCYKTGYNENLENIADPNIKIINVMHLYDDM